MRALRSWPVETLPPWLLLFRFKGFFKCFIVLILRWFNHEEPTLFVVMFAAPRFVAMPTQLLGRSFAKLSSLVNFFGARAWMAVEGAVGLGMAGRGATLVLRTSWFNCSSWIRAKKIAAIRVYGSRAFTSPRISSFKPSIKVEVRIVAIMGIALEGGGVDDDYRGSKIAALIPYDRTPDGAL
ncbi:hypothetical protein B296_00021476 [Ensete ventricosum]|uniref:Uncharacterized protein n=1 Tax=Ensete ventricosum TaxID=4639 RepID=A0A426YL50_ENSVE|nr:hypothetical protein B296_00021476 [Ensete ventricosum]